MRPYAGSLEPITDAASRVNLALGRRYTAAGSLPACFPFLSYSPSV
jgi:hypothetical protein